MYFFIFFKMYCMTSKPICSKFGTIKLVLGRDINSTVWTRNGSKIKKRVMVFKGLNKATQRVVKEKTQKALCPDQEEEIITFSVLFCSEILLDGLQSMILLDIIDHPSEVKVVLGLVCCIVAAQE